MRFDKFTLKSQEAVQNAQALAEKSGHQQVDSLHLLAALLGQEDGVVVPTLQKVGADLAALKAAALTELDKLPKVSGAAAGQLYVSPALKESFRPEFLNRVDETIIFHGLGKEEIRKIVDLQLRHLEHTLDGQHLKLKVTPAARGLDRFCRRGESACASEWAVMCATHNLLKLYHSGKVRPFGSAQDRQAHHTLMPAVSAVEPSNSKATRN